MRVQLRRDEVIEADDYNQDVRELEYRDDLGLASDFQTDVALVEQPHRFETALLQGLEIPLHTFGVAHTYIDAGAGPEKLSRVSTIDR